MPKKNPLLTRATLHGVWCALIVPWTDRDAVDARRFVREIRAYAGTGVHGIYTGGTTGEFYGQDDPNFTRITEIACEQAREIGLPVQIGVSALSTRNVCRRIKIALREGTDAIQVALKSERRCNLRGTNANVQPLRLEAIRQGLYVND
jgi:dihydrodipicolinate synthase/N-acetylneuraminate lyase